MIRNILIIFFSFNFFILNSPSYSFDLSSKAIENYTLKISKKFAKTFCNSIKFGISQDSALRFSIGETNKEFSNKKINQYIDYELLNKNILVSLKNDCQIYDFPINELEKLSFRN